MVYSQTFARHSYLSLISQVLNQITRTAKYLLAEAPTLPRQSSCTKRTLQIDLPTRPFIRSTRLWGIPYKISNAFHNSSLSTLSPIPVCSLQTLDVRYSSNSRCLEIVCLSPQIFMSIFLSQNYTVSL